MQILSKHDANWYGKRLTTEPNRYRVASLMRLRAAAWAICWLLSSLSLGDDGAYNSVSSEVLEQFSIERDGDALLVPVTIGDREWHFMVDTGAAITVFDKRLEPYLGKQREGGAASTPNGSAKAGIYEPPLIRLGRLFVTPNTGVACLSLDRMRKATGYEIDGLLGMDVLSRLVVRLDFDHGTLSVLRSASPTANAVSLTRLRPPTIELTFPGGQDLSFVIDTGDISRRSGSIHSTVFSRLKETGSLSLLGTTNVSDASATAIARQGVVRECRTFGIRLVGTVWGEHHGNERNNISLYFLTQFNLTLDFANRRLFFEKNESFGHPDMVDLSGLHFLRANGRVTVESVDKTSPAERCGIRPGDVIAAIDGLDAGQGRLFTLRKALSRPGARAAVMVENASGTSQKTLQLPARLAP